ncbi:MAG: response regulator transcription factor [Raoultibacter sp.]|jgi:DNA-binding response OmpR family regulator
MNILVAEDEKRLAEALRFLLEREGHRVDLVNDGKTALAYIESETSYDLLIFDIMMPHIGGLELLNRIRKDSVDTPVLMLTALSETSDKVRGLDLGADDYMTKPFQPEELLARVRALTRRTGEVVLEELHFADLRLDLHSRELSSTNEEGSHEVCLSEKEHEVLSLLMRNAGQIISKEQLMMRVWGYDTYIEDNNVEAYISFLRKKLRYLRSHAAIETIRSVGYTLAEPKDPR